MSNVRLARTRMCNWLAHSRISIALAHSRLRIALTVCALAAAVSPRAVVAQDSMLGYAPASAAAQRAIEERFRNGVSAASLSALHLPLTRRPHPAGSAGGEAVVSYLQQTLRSFGLDVQTFEYRAWLSSPRSVRVTMLAPTVRELSLREAAIAEDPTSAHPELRESYVAYSASGTAEGEIVYVNYGLPDDYRELASHGVSVQGRIAVARYGRSHRAVKVFTAQEAGARALILYSDPADDGFTRGMPWPNGYWRGEDMPQRGNAKLSWFFHGDPLTPGVAALADAKRLDPTKAPTLPRIPVVAMGWGEARHLLSTVGGPPAPERWRGGIPIEYRLGPGATVRVAVDLDDGLRPIHNIVARIRGAVEPDRLVMLGTHHDAWTFGGVDPGTGTTALLETARVLGEMSRSGWRPARTIALAFWDAEEFGLIGSTEYAEQFREQLQSQLVLYVNTDLYMRGHLDAGGVPSLRDFVVDVARSVPDFGGSVLDGWRGAEWERRAPARRPASAAQVEVDLKSLGSGADFVPFQDFLGVPTLSIEFTGSNAYGFGTYHSNFDSRAYVERIADPGFKQGVTMSRMLGTIALRMADADVLPFRFSHYASRLVAALNDAKSWGPGTGGATRVPLDLTTLEARARRAHDVATLLERTIDSRIRSAPLPRATASRLNDRLARLEQALADDDGDPATRWYRHVFYGWNIYSLYDGQPFPGLAEGLRIGSETRTKREVERIARALDRMIDALSGALTDVERGAND